MIKKYEMLNPVFVSFNFTMDEDLSGTATEATETTKKSKAYESCRNCPEYVVPYKLKSNDYFCCESYVRRAVADFCDANHHPLLVSSTEKDNPEKGVRAKIVYKCTHAGSRLVEGGL